MSRFAIPRLAIAALLLAFATVGLAVEAQPDTTQQVQVLDINSADASGDSRGAGWHWFDQGAGNCRLQRNVWQLPFCGRAG